MWAGSRASTPRRPRPRLLFLKYQAVAVCYYHLAILFSISPHSPFLINQDDQIEYCSRLRFQSVASCVSVSLSRATRPTKAQPSVLPENEQVRWSQPRLFLSFSRSSAPRHCICLDSRERRPWQQRRRRRQQQQQQQQQQLLNSSDSSGRRRRRRRRKKHQNQQWHCSLPSVMTLPRLGRVFQDRTNGHQLVGRPALFLSQSRSRPSLSPSPFCPGYAVPVRCGCWERARL